MIRRPYIAEGFIMGGLAAIFALLLNSALHFWQKSVMSSSLVLARVVPQMSFLNPWLIIGILVIGAVLGAFGAWITVRKINDGWSASQAAES